MSHELIVLRTHIARSAAPHQAATPPRYTPPYAAATNAVAAAAAITKHYYYLLGIYPKRSESLAWFTMATFTLILWSHVVHFDAIFS